MAAGITSAIFHLTSYIMSEISDAIQAKCLAFSDRIIKLTHYRIRVTVIG
jgi:hypothetical protein